MTKEDAIIYKKAEERVVKFINSHEPDTFIKNEHGVYMYQNGSSHINLKLFFNDLAFELYEEFYQETEKLREENENLKRINLIKNNLNDELTIISTKQGAEIDELQEELTNLRTLYENKKAYAESLEKKHKEDVIKSVCDCVIPKPKDPYHELDKNICRDCNGNIEQTEL